MKKIMLVSIVSFFILACGRSFKPDYKVTDASQKNVPSWIMEDNAHKSDSDGGVKDYRYFISDAHSADNRLCIKSAEARATQKIASEIAQEIMARYDEETKAVDKNINRKIKDTLQQSVQVNLHGVKVTGTYWEKRSYLKQLGASEDKIAYKCDAAVRISKVSLVDALETYKKRTVAQLDSDARRIMDMAVNETIKEIEENE